MKFHEKLIPIYLLLKIPFRFMSDESFIRQGKIINIVNLKFVDLVYKT